MKKLGKISVIHKEYASSNIQTMQSELAKHKMTRVPGTGVFKYPYKELDGKYRTGLDPDAAYIRRIPDTTARKVEIERIKKDLKTLRDMVGDIDLGPRSSFWNYALSKSSTDTTHVQPVKLIDGDNLFDLSVPSKLIAFSWLRVHPTIASSYQAWERGEYPVETQFFVADEEVEQQILFKKKRLINKAISTFDDMTPTKKKKVARLLGLPVTEDTSEEVVYNEIDNVLKQTEFKKGKYKGLSPIEVFNRYATMKEGILHVKDLIKQATIHSIYRVRANGRIYEGEYEIAKDEDALVVYLMDEDNQEDLLMLEEKLKIKKIATT